MGRGRHRQLRDVMVGALRPEDRAAVRLGAEVVLRVELHLRRTDVNLARVFVGLADDARPRPVGGFRQSPSMRRMVDAARAAGWDVRFEVCRGMWDGGA